MDFPYVRTYFSLSRFIIIADDWGNLKDFATEFGPIWRLMVRVSFSLSQGARGCNFSDRPSEPGFAVRLLTAHEGRSRAPAPPPRPLPSRARSPEPPHHGVGCLHGSHPPMRAKIGEIGEGENAFCRQTERRFETKWTKSSIKRGTVL